MMGCKLDLMEKIFRENIYLFILSVTKSGIFIWKFQLHCFNLITNETFWINWKSLDCKPFFNCTAIKKLYFPIFWSLTSSSTKLPLIDFTTFTDIEHFFLLNTKYFKMLPSRITINMSMFMFKNTEKCRKRKF